MYYALLSSRAVLCCLLIQLFRDPSSCSLCVSVDKCSVGGSGTDYVVCPSTADSNGFTACPPVGQDGSCSAGGKHCMSDCIADVT